MWSVGWVCRNLKFAHFWWFYEIQRESQGELQCFVKWSESWGELPCEMQGESWSESWGELQGESRAKFQGELQRQIMN